MTGAYGARSKRGLDVGAYAAFFHMVHHGKFEFGEDGRVSRRTWYESILARDERILVRGLWVLKKTPASRPNRNGYRRIPFRLGGQRFEVMEHVAFWIWKTGTWPRKGMQVNHKDLDRGNGRLENLELVSQGRNLRHAAEMRRNGVKGGKR